MARWPAATIAGYVGVSGSPIPRLMTSTPAACFSAILRSSSANRYGVMRLRRSLGLIQLLAGVGAGLSWVCGWGGVFWMVYSDRYTPRKSRAPPRTSSDLLQLVREFLAEACGEDGARPAGLVHPQVLPHLH